MGKKHHLKGIFETMEIFLDKKKLEPWKSLRLRNHSPDGFQYGYAGSGPAQLSLAILLEIMPQDEAMANYQEFKHQVIAKLPQKDFEIDFIIGEHSTEKNPIQTLEVTVI